MRNRQYIKELGEELGFTVSGSSLVLHPDAGSRAAMRNDVRNIGNDMRKVIARERL